jgi:predicted ester cyclase
MVGDPNKATAARLHEEIIGRRQLELADELLARDCAGHTPEHREFTGPEGLKQAVDELHNSFSDLSVEVTEQFAEDDRVITGFSIRGAHTGRYLGTRPTKRRFEIGGAGFTRHKDDRISEYWAQWDRRALLEQLGAVPVMQGQSRG